MTENTFKYAEGTHGRKIEETVLDHLANYETLVESFGPETAQAGIESAVWNSLYIAENVKEKIDQFFAGLAADQAPTKEGTIGRSIADEVAKQVRSYKSLSESLSNENSQSLVESVVWMDVFVAERVKEEVDLFFAALAEDQAAPVRKEFPDSVKKEVDQFFDKIEEDQARAISGSLDVTQESDSIEATGEVVCRICWGEVEVEAVQVYPSTREEPAEYEDRAECLECGWRGREEETLPRAELAALAVGLDDLFSNQEVLFNGC